MAETFQLSILTPEKRFHSGEVKEIIFSTPEGSIGVMANHMPMVAAVSSGTIDVFKTDGSKRTAAIGLGFAMIGKETEMFVDTAEWAEEINAVRAKEALIRAEMRLKMKLGRVEYIQTLAAMSRALARIKAAGENDA